MSLNPDFNILSPEKKRQHRLAEWLNPVHVQFISDDAKKAYQKRAQRFVDVLNVEEPDRVPIMSSVGSIPAYEHGMDYRTVSYDFDKLSEIWRKFNDKHAEDLDSFALPFFISPSKVLDIIDYKLYNWPGHNLPDNSRGIQFVENEYMKADEYDAFLRDPSDFFLRTYLPRISGVFEPFKMLKPLTHAVELGMTDFMPLSMPNMQAALQSLMDAGKEYGKYMQTVMPMIFNAMASGFPSPMGGFCKAPFDTLADTMRGTKGIIMDMYRQPEKVLAAVDRIAELSIETTIQSAEMMKSVMIFFPLHKGADGWMNQKQFDTFYWPSLKKVINALNNEGFIVQLFAEGTYTSRLDSVNEFPKGFASWWFDQTDIQKAKEILGKDCCIFGNLPSSLFVTSTPKEVKKQSRELIETVGKGGGFVLCPGAFGDEMKVENLKAMAAAAKEYGRYR